MKRSRIGPKTFEDAAARYKPMQRKPLHSRSRMKRGTKRLGPGKKTKAWAAIWIWLKAEFEKRGRTKCEFHFIKHECSQIQTPAHSKKRRMIQGDEIYHVATACSVVHQILDEKMSHEEMEAAVMRAINENGGVILP